MSALEHLHQWLSEVGAFFAALFGVAVAAPRVALEKADGSKVLRLHLAADVRSELQAFLAWWDISGPFALTLAYADPRWSWVPPQVRTNEDARNAHDLGLSNATNADNTPHGELYRAAIDCWPAEFDPRVSWDNQPQAVKDKFALYGQLGEQHGLKWGGRWRGPTFPNGDQPHLEVPGWKNGA